MLFDYKAPVDDVALVKQKLKRPGEKTPKEGSFFSVKQQTVRVFVIKRWDDMAG